MAEIDTATDEDFARFYGGMQVSGRWVGRAMRRGRLIAGFGGFIELEAGKWLAFLEVPKEERKPHVYRHALEAFKEAQKQGASRIIAWCDSSIPNAVKLMTRMGFEKTDEMIDGKEGWAWER